MIKNLVTFGCSWTLGVELEDPTTESYPAKIAAHYGWAVENLASPNTTLNEMLLDMGNWLANQTEEHIAETLILIGLTDENRGSTNGEETYELMVQGFELKANEYDARLLQFNVITQNHKIKVPSLIESSSALEMLVIRDKPRKDPLFAEFKHPNEKGHKIISEFLIDKIDSVIMHE